MKLPVFYIAVSLNFQFLMSWLKLFISLVWNFLFVCYLCLLWPQSLRVWSEILSKRLPLIIFLLKNLTKVASIRLRFCFSVSLVGSVLHWCRKCEYIILRNSFIYSSCSWCSRLQYLNLESARPLWFPADIYSRWYDFGP